MEKIICYNQRHHIPIGFNLTWHSNPTPFIFLHYSYSYKSKEPKGLPFLCSVKVKILPVWLCIKRYIFAYVGNGVNLQTGFPKKDNPPNNNISFTQLDLATAISNLLKVPYPTSWRKGKANNYQHATWLSPSRPKPSYSCVNNCCCQFWSD
jgi:hypothetical protein